MRDIVSVTVAAACLLMAASGTAQAQAGAGGVSCGQYLRSARSSDILYHQASNWLLGYISGVSATMPVAPG